MSYFPADRGENNSCAASTARLGGMHPPMPRERHEPTKSNDSYYSWPKDTEQETCRWKRGHVEQCGGKKGYTWVVLSPWTNAKRRFCREYQSRGIRIFLNPWPHSRPYMLTLIFFILFFSCKMKQALVSLIQWIWEIIETFPSNLRFENLTFLKGKNQKKNQINYIRL